MGKFKIRTYNNIAISGLERFPREFYEVASEIQYPDAIILRSYRLSPEEIPETVKAVGRAGVGVNNIPVAELTLAGLFLASRNICQAWHFVRQLQAPEEELHAIVEKEKRRFKGFEVRGKMLGVIGLGAIGVKVANRALSLGMSVVGYDPHITVERAWQLSSSVVQATGIDELLSLSDFVTLHVPLNQETRGMIDRRRLGLMRRGTVLLNFSRGELVEEEALLEALEGGHLHAYVTDFPSQRLKDHPKVVALPHIGASTREAEENCAVMVANQIRDFLEHGNIRNSVNFPEVVLPPVRGQRLAVAHANIPGMVSGITSCLSDAELNIIDLLNKSRGEVAYSLVDVEGEIPEEVVERIGATEGILSVRKIQPLETG